MLCDVIASQKKVNDKLISYIYKILNRIAFDMSKEKTIINSGVIEASGEALG